jgi:hypothetical protein
MCALQNLIMSESATMMVEFEHLSRVTGDAKYHNAVRQRVGLEP